MCCAFFECVFFLLEESRLEFHSGERINESFLFNGFNEQLSRFIRVTNSFCDVEVVWTLALFIQRQNKVGCITPQPVCQLYRFHLRGNDLLVCGVVCTPVDHYWSLVFNACLLSRCTTLTRSHSERAEGTSCWDLTVSSVRDERIRPVPDCLPASIIPQQTCGGST